MSNAVTQKVMRCLVPILKAASFTETIARDVSRRQSELSTNPQLQRALRQQSRQEAAHAAGFDAALIYMGVRAPADTPLIGAVEEFGRRLSSDLEAGHLAASMFGLQCVLEGLGSVALEPTPGELTKAGDRLVPLRDIVLHQEIAHRRLGEVWVPRLYQAASPEGRGIIDAARRDYVALAQGIVEAGLPILEELVTDREHFQRSAHKYIETLRTAQPTVELEGVVS